MVKILVESDILKFVKLLAKKQNIFIPQEKDAETVFALFTKESKLTLDYQTTVLPPKHIFLPPEEKLFITKREKVTEPTPPKPFIVFGLNLKDLAAICQLDEIMSKEPADSFYLKRREKAVLIVISDEEIGTPASPAGGPPGGDLILEKTNTGYRAIPLTKAGRKIANLSVFKTRESDPKRSDPVEPTRLEEMLLDSELLARAVEWSRENCPEIWERLGKICLGCGICTYVCPLCHCFTIKDETSLDQSICTRCRNWDACTLPGFATIGGGHNFRPTIKDRYYNWYYHKFVRAYKEFGRSQCVACGRCQKYCPAGIDVEKILEEIVAKFQKAHPERKF